MGSDFIPRCLKFMFAESTDAYHEDVLLEITLTSIKLCFGYDPSTRLSILSEIPPLACQSTYVASPWSVVYKNSCDELFFIVKLEDYIVEVDIHFTAWCCTHNLEMWILWAIDEAKDISDSGLYCVFVLAAVVVSEQAVVDVAQVVAESDKRVVEQVQVLDTEIGALVVFESDQVGTWVELVVAESDLFAALAVSGVSLALEIQAVVWAKNEGLSLHIVTWLAPSSLGLDGSIVRV
ncbi:hypothetical protein Dimus_031976 [Dionaea muscipula]